MGRALRIVICECNMLGRFMGKLLSKTVNVEVQYADLSKPKEPKPKTNIGSNWCKYSEGDIYIICGNYDYHLLWIPYDTLVFKLSDYTLEHQK